MRERGIYDAQKPEQEGWVIVVKTVKWHRRTFLISVDKKMENIVRKTGKIPIDSCKKHIKSCCNSICLVFEKGWYEFLEFCMAESRKSMPPLTLLRRDQKEHLGLQFRCPKKKHAGCVIVRRRCDVSIDDDLWTSAVNLFYTARSSRIYTYMSFLLAVGRDVVRRQANYTLNLPFLTKSKGTSLILTLTYSFLFLRPLTEAWCPVCAVYM